IQHSKRTVRRFRTSGGVDMAQISAELGHSNLATTVTIYTHILKTPSQSSRGIASTINKITENGQKVGKKTNEKPSRRFFAINKRLNRERVRGMIDIFRPLDYHIYANNQSALALFCPKGAV
ncbi:MAG: hypothetical protein U0L88_01040, partial [Acutalibacteraceae bacterium]|nr:hypothetical protein [Acutalibacteraceae bacterium]